MRLCLLGLLVVFICSGVLADVVDPGELSRYDVVRTVGPIVVDGVLDKKEWGHAPVMTGFSDVFKAGRPVRYETTAKMLWDDKYLYVAFECVDEDIWGTLTKFDSPVYVEEAVEVFIDPEGRGRYYWEIDVSPRNTVIDLMIPSNWMLGGPKNSSYNVIGLRTAVKVYGTLDDRTDKDEKWTVEMAIPWADFMGRKVNVPPKDGDSWRVNLFRIDRPGAEDMDDQYLSWSKSPGAFHEPKNFGVITFRH